MAIAALLVTGAIVFFALANLLLCMLPTKRPTAWRRTKWASLAAVLAFGGAIYLIVGEQQEKAAKRGFESFSEMADAEKSGFTDAKAYREAKTKVSADLAAKQRAAEGRALDVKRNSEEICRIDLQCIGKKLAVPASVHCKSAIEKLAKYSHEWTDGWMEPKFSRYRWSDNPGGKVTLIGDRIKFQNGFGAWQNSIYECDMDPLTEQPTAVRARAGRL